MEPIGDTIRKVKRTDNKTNVTEYKSIVSVKEGTEKLYVFLSAIILKSKKSS